MTFYEETEKLFIRPLSRERLGRPIGDLICACPLWEVVLAVGVREPDGRERLLEKKEGIKEQALFGMAYANTCRAQRPRIYGDWTELLGGGGGEGDFMREGAPYRLCRGAEGSTLTTTARVNGAVALFEPGVARRLGEILAGDYYVAFPSVHFVKIHRCAETSLPDVRRTAGRMRSAPRPEEYLSDRVYRYVRAAGRFQEV